MPNRHTQLALPSTAPELPRRFRDYRRHGPSPEPFQPCALRLKYDKSEKAGSERNRPRSCEQPIKAPSPEAPVYPAGVCNSSFFQAFSALILLSTIPSSVDAVLTGLQKVMNG